MYLHIRAAEGPLDNMIMIMIMIMGVGLYPSVAVTSYSLSFISSEGEIGPYIERPTSGTVSQYSARSLRIHYSQFGNTGDEKLVARGRN
jgi:hypothetical protein